MDNQLHTKLQQHQLQGQQLRLLKQQQLQQQYPQSLTTQQADHNLSDYGLHGFRYSPPNAQNIGKYELLAIEVTPPQCTPMYYYFHEQSSTYRPIPDDLYETLRKVFLYLPQASQSCLFVPNESKLFEFFSLLPNELNSFNPGIMSFGGIFIRYFTVRINA